MNRTVSFRIIAISLLVTLLAGTGLWAQVRPEIQIPDILGYRTLKCDFHMHTVFSDGSVWPTVRVDEAWREGLDVISITDHIEYQPHKDDVPTNHNRPYEIAQGHAKARGILLIRGTEITRATPPGHFNAIFLQDVDPLDTKELLDVMAEARKQDAFIFWNHPGWKPDKEGWLDIHTTLYDRGYMQGIEVVNGGSYYPLSHKWAIEKNLTFMANSDIHAPSLRQQTTPEDHRSMTLVFAKAKTSKAVKEALVAGRTAIWYKNQLIGRKVYLEAIVDAAVTIKRISYPDYPDNPTAHVRLSNTSDLTVELERTGKLGPATLTLPPRSMALVKAKVGQGQSPAEFEYVAKNFLIAPGQGLPVTVKIPRPITITIEADTETPVMR